MSVLQQHIAAVIIHVIFWSGLVAPAVLATFWPWWRSELGWSICAKTIALSLVLVPAELETWFGSADFEHSQALQWFSLAALAAIPVIVWWRVWVIFKTQREGSRHL